MSDQTAAAPPPTNRTSRWLKLALILSLAVNVLVFGAIAGAWWRGAPGPWGGRGAGNIIGYIASLPPDRRAELMQRSKGLREQSRALRQASRQASRDRTAALLAEPFDKQRYIDAQTRQIEAEQRLRLSIRDIVAEAASSMSAAERRSFLNWRDRHGPPPAEMSDEPPPLKR